MSNWKVGSVYFLSSDNEKYIKKTSIVNTNIIDGIRRISNTKGDIYFEVVDLSHDGVQTIAMINDVGNRILITPESLSSSKDFKHCIVTLFNEMEAELFTTSNISIGHITKPTAEHGTLSYPKWVLGECYTLDLDNYRYIKNIKPIMYDFVSQIGHPMAGMLTHLPMFKVTKVGIENGGNTVKAIKIDYKNKYYEVDSYDLTDINGVSLKSLFDASECGYFDIIPHDNQDRNDSLQNSDEFSDEFVEALRTMIPNEVYVNNLYFKSVDDFINAVKSQSCYKKAV